MSTGIDYRTGLPVPENLRGKLYSPRDLLDAKLAADCAPVAEMMADMEARAAVRIAAAKASIALQIAELEDGSSSVAQKVAA